MMTSANVLSNTERLCARCGQVFVVDISVRGHWLQKYCSVGCRKVDQNEKRCRVLGQTKVNQDRSSFSGVNKCQWCSEPFVVTFEHRTLKCCPKPKTCAHDIQKTPKVALTDEQREANELLRRQRSADGRRGQIVSQERRDRTSETLRNRYAAGEISVVTTEMTPERRAKISVGMVQAYRDGRANLTGYYKNKWSMYEGSHGSIKMRSHSEVLFALHLDDAGIDWLYEPQRFDLGWATYTPDFHLPTLNRWIEVKGAWTETSQRKFAEFSVDHLSSVVMAKDILSFADWEQPVSPVPKGVVPW